MPAELASRHVTPVALPASPGPSSSEPTLCVTSSPSGISLHLPVTSQEAILTSDRPKTMPLGTQSDSGATYSPLSTFVPDLFGVE